MRDAQRIADAIKKAKKSGEGWVTVGYHRLKLVPPMQLCRDCAGRRIRPHPAGILGVAAETCERCKGSSFDPQDRLEDHRLLGRELVVARRGGYAIFEAFARKGGHSNGRLEGWTPRHAGTSTSARKTCEPSSPRSTTGHERHRRRAALSPRQGSRPS